MQNQEITEWLYRLSESARKARPILEEISRRLQYTQKGAPEVFYNLSRYGWYIDGLITPKKTFKLNELLVSGQVVEVDNFFSEYFENRLDLINEKLIKNYPTREHIVNEGFRNHKEGRYNSAITILLTQVDGFCYDRYKKFFFINQKTRKGTKKHVPQIEEELIDTTNWVIEALIAPIQKPTAISEHTSKLIDFPVNLNRHQIIHGMVTDYGSKLNSLKVISLLNYVDEILE